MTSTAHDDQTVHYTDTIVIDTDLRVRISTEGDVHDFEIQFEGDDEPQGQFFFGDEDVPKLVALLLSLSAGTKPELEVVR